MKDWFDIAKRTQEDLESIFENFFFLKSPIAMKPEAVWRPAADVYQTKDHVVVCVELAGVPKDTIEIIVHGDVLTVSGVRKEKVPGAEKRSYYKMEIVFGPFERRIHLPCHCDADDAVVEEISGLVRVTMPKQEEPSVEVTEIEIE